MRVLTFRMGHTDRIPESERSDVLAVPETDLPTHVGADDSHAEQDARHRRDPSGGGNRAQVPTPTPGGTWATRCRRRIAPAP